jgi:exonuclease III
MIGFKEVSVLSWNVWGAANNRAKRHITDVVRKYSPTFLLIMETHTCFQKTKLFWKRIGYVNTHCVDARGHSGGIWLLKQQGSNITADVFEVYKDTITVRLSLGNERWFFTGIYASPIHTSRLELWEHLTELRRDITDPWLLMGDFNEIISVCLFGKPINLIL